MQGALANPRNPASFMPGFAPRSIAGTFAARRRLAKFHVCAFGSFAPR